MKTTWLKVLAKDGMAVLSWPRRRFILKGMGDVFSIYVFPLPSVSIPALQKKQKVEGVLAVLPLVG